MAQIILEHDYEIGFFFFKNKVNQWRNHYTTKNEHMFDVWKYCNMMVILWIRYTLTLQIGQNTVDIDNEQELWKDLRENFSKSDYRSFIPGF